MANGVSARVVSVGRDKFKGYWGTAERQDGGAKIRFKSDQKVEVGDVILLEWEPVDQRAISSSRTGTVKIVLE